MVRGITLFVLLFVVLSCVLPVGCSQSSTVEWVVDHKVLSGIKDSTQYTIVLDRPNDDGTPIRIVEDNDFRALFPLHAELVVSEYDEGQMRAVYSGFVYQVSLRKSPDDTLGYLTTREIFNEMSLGATVKCQVSGLRIVKIKA